ncbi:hypothetical protein B0H14DRAFT_2615148 [Mycena olivaceomarginata]|nr:hypothetical protein B0H14DRAFT_2615148 [Mycena olivaceomarginata]
MWIQRTELKSYELWSTTPSDRKSGVGGVEKNEVRSWTKVGTGYNTLIVLDLKAESGIAMSVGEENKSFRSWDDISHHKRNAQECQKQENQTVEHVVAQLRQEWRKHNAAKKLHRSGHQEASAPRGKYSQMIVRKVGAQIRCNPKCVALPAFLGVLFPLEPALENDTNVVRTVGETIGLNRVMLAKTVILIEEAWICDTRPRRRVHKARYEFGGRLGVPLRLSETYTENPKFYEDTTSIIQVFGDLWWSMKTYCQSMGVFHALWMSIDLEHLLQCLLQSQKLNCVSMRSTIVQLGLIVTSTKHG